jgi:hypothetical protein
VPGGLPLGRPEIMPLGYIVKPAGNVSIKLLDASEFVAKDQV